MLTLSTGLADLEQLSLSDSKTLVTGFGPSSQLRSILSDVTQQRMRPGFHWLPCFKALSGPAGTLGDTLALSGTGGEQISAQ